jgi:hypothetical protein
MNIEGFKAEQNQRNGVLKNNRFRVIIPPAPVLSSFSDVHRTLQFWCHGANFPGYQIQTHNVRRYTYGTNEARPFAPNFQQIQLQFISDGDTYCWEFFNHWMQNVLPHDADRGINSASLHTGGPVYLLNYREQYVTDMYIEIYDAEGNAVKTVQIREAFPVNLNPIQLDWSFQNQFAGFNVFMEYLDWQVADQQEVAPSGALPEPPG